MRNIGIAIFTAVICVLIPGMAGAASLYLAPPDGAHVVGDSFSVSVGVNSGGTAINSAQATISFPTNLLTVTNVSQNGVFSLWPVSPTYSNESGTVTFAGGLPNPGYNGSSGTIITITFQGTAAGTADVNIGSATVLANDGFGTNVFDGASGGSYVISAAPEPEELELPAAPTITSTTHPEQALWYNVSDSAFSWNRENGVTGFSYVYDDQPATVPDQVRDTTDAGVSFAGTGDGTWYFHVRAQNSDGWGPAAHYQVNIDATPPAAFSIDLLDGKRTTDTTPQISFETTDATSGIHHYDVIVDSGSAVGLDVGETTPYTLPELPLGRHSVIAKAYDQADNVTQAENSFTVYSPGEPLPADTDADEEATEEEKKNLSDRISEQFDKLAPEPIKNVARQIGETVKKVRENKTAKRVVDDVAEPVVTTSAIVVAAGIASSASGSTQIPHLAYLLFRFGYFWLVPISLSKKRKPWGTVFDSITGEPVSRAVVRIFSREFNKLKSSSITDKGGRFGFLVEKGVYYITVKHPGYSFPSKIMTTAAITKYPNIYRGDTFEIKEEKEGLVSANIPIDPDTKSVPQDRVRWLRTVNLLGNIVEKLNIPFLIAGTVLSWATLILKPTTANGLILGLYGFLILFHFISSRKLGRSWGLVRDQETGKPVEQAVVRIYNADTSRLMWTRVTNTKGQFNGLLSSGRYYLVIIKNGYQPFQSKPVKVSKQKGYIRFTADLKPRRKAELPPATEKDVDIRLESINTGANTEPPAPERPKPSTPPPTSSADVFRPPPLIEQNQASAKEQEKQSKKATTKKSKSKKKKQV